MALCQALALAERLLSCGTGFIGLEYDNPDRPEAANLLAIYSLVTGRSIVRLPVKRLYPASRMYQAATE